MSEVTVEVFIYRDGEPYDSMGASDDDATMPIDEARHWLGNVIDNDPSLTGNNRPLER